MMAGAALAPWSIAGATQTPSPLRGPDDLTRPIRVSDNGHFLVQPNGEPFFWLADTGWAICARLTRDEIDEYLHDRADKGFNVIQTVCIGGPFDMLEAPNRNGDLALINRDFARPNPRYFEHIDWTVARARHYGIRMALLPVWGASLVGGQQVSGPTMNPAQAHWYGRWIATRYRNQGVIWVLGGDTNPLWPGEGAFLRMNEEAAGEAEPAARVRTLVDYRPVYDAMAAGLIEGDGGDPFITFHPNPTSFSGMARPRTSIYFHEREWLDMNMLQSSHFANEAPTVFPQMGFDYSMIGPNNYEYVRQEYDSSPTHPVLDGEPRYEGIPVDISYNPDKGIWDAYDARNAAYHALFAGAAGHTFGNLSVHLSYNPAIQPPMSWYPGDIARHWRSELNSLGAQHMRHLKALMLSRPYFNRVPDQSVLRSAENAGEAHVGATRDDRGQFVMIFTPKGASVEVDMTKIAGPRAVAWWYDPRTGAATQLDRTFRTTGVRSFRPPTSGDDQDWVLVLDSEAARFNPPGQPPA
jgi:hypothetical protein